MAAIVHVHAKVEKALEQMATQDNAPQIAAQRARSIIKALVNGVRITKAGRLSLRKDARFRNLYKFNLGKGFRLISIKENDEIYLMHVGTHDHCDRWLDTNSKKSPHKEPIPIRSYGISKKSGTNKKTTRLCPGNEFEAMDFLPEPSQDQLREVFCGLVGCSQRSCI